MILGSQDTGSHRRVEHKAYGSIKLLLSQRLLHCVVLIFDNLSARSSPIFVSPAIDHCRSVLDATWRARQISQSGDFLKIFHGHIPIVSKHRRG